MEAILQTEHLHLSFHGIQAVQDVGFDVLDGEIFGIIGPNGAGKTSVLNCINGFYRPQRGRITFRGREISGLPPHVRAQLGLSRTFQNIALYPGMTVLDNIMTGRAIRMRSGVLACGLYWGPAQREHIAHRAAVEEIIDFLEIEAVRDARVADLSYGLQKKVELGRALATEPALLILDEPMAGMSVDEKADMARYILELKEVRHLPMILIEHDMGVVMDLCDRIMVMDYGRKIAEGPPAEIQRHPEVIRAYIGTEALA
ncbi:MAG: ABC transporter ATP-binding protein [Armatimonadota bacterium]|nr:ABC transporter ATP-binding protein [Armatimonadota bacterium]MDR7450452.1 ABC transporter ATP-binding protein [Armatimonadota bacterium]MDR7466965.1 ABC transporter ATP-binding protein [Armatimonadota bacterium]MDR7493493.1 ABC transporter ATP-binding protein [Armatimonadota bacterium]MDR7498758.1 ABC transporter ATP-binding protein [Armatimonadota bacterium]